MGEEFKMHIGSDEYSDVFGRSSGRLNSDSGDELSLAEFPFRNSNQAEALDSKTGSEVFLDLIIKELSCQCFFSPYTVLQIVGIAASSSDPLLSLMGHHLAER
ncbi:hypothetical protein H5410_008817 [Solanum commersonii]|uniref:Uncharacterized protein n=1 Tax=Solanum commersonii TaxID=4109 RepID=A0A9J6AHV4_SOLCO|nr:hypothetical protein H5410_008817 [Solanum commersonii]